MNHLQLMAEAKRPLAMHPKKFALWLFMATVVMLFMAFTSAYIVRRAEGNWTFYELPSILWYTSGMIILSSLTMIWAVRSAKKDNLDSLKIALGITAVLGLGFLYGQYVALFSDLVGEGAYFTGGNVSSSFIYVLTGVHAVHLVSGVIFLIIVLISAVFDNVHAKQMTRLEMCATYWHFLGGLWIYLFIFLMLYR